MLTSAPQQVVLNSKFRGDWDVKDVSKMLEKKNQMYDAQTMTVNIISKIRISVKPTKSNSF
jgi:hypothetical protein